MRLESSGREYVGRGEDRFAAKRADAGLVENSVGTRDLCGTTGTFGGFLFLTSSGGIGVVELGNGTEETFAIFDGEFDEEAPIGFEAFEEFGGLTREFG